MLRETRKPAGMPGHTSAGAQDLVFSPRAVGAWSRLATCPPLPLRASCQLAPRSPAAANTRSLALSLARFAQGLPTEVGPAPAADDPLDISGPRGIERCRPMAQARPP